GRHPEYSRGSGLLPKHQVPLGEGRGLGNRESRVRARGRLHRRMERLAQPPQGPAASGRGPAMIAGQLITRLERLSALVLAFMLLRSAVTHLNNPPITF